MRTGRSYVLTAVAIGAITLTGCAAEAPSASDSKPIPDTKDWGDETLYPNLGGAFHSLTAFTGTCAFATGTMTVTSTTAQSFVIGKRAVDSAILVNGAQLANCTTATSSNVKQLKVVGSGSDETVVIDFLGGVFAPGIATARGIVFELAGGTDEVRVRGTTGNDSWVFGSEGLAINTDAFRDMDFTGVERFNFALASGNDNFTATVVNSTGGLGYGKGVTSSATASQPVVAFGGVGNDVMTGGLGSDKLYGGAGADTLAGGGAGAGGEVDALHGEDGVDTFAQGADMDGPDKIYCGSSQGERDAAANSHADPDAADVEVDVVTYAARGSTTAETERVYVRVSECDDADGDQTDDDEWGCDLDADGFPVYASNSGNTSDGTYAGITENDKIGFDCEHVIGGTDNDTLEGEQRANTLSGGPGDDTLIGGEGADVLNGNDGNDTFDEGSGETDATLQTSAYYYDAAQDTDYMTGGDTFNGGAGTDTVDYSGRDSIAGGGAGANPVVVTMDGTAADDGVSGELDNVKSDVENLIGTDANDDITGNAADNTLTGGLGDDELSGEAGADTFDEGDADSGSDTFNGGLGTDTVDYSARTVAVWVTMDGATANDGEATNIPDESDPDPLNWVAGTSAEADDVKEDVEGCVGSDQADWIVGNLSANELIGGAGADYLAGGDANDTLEGGAGDDTLMGEAGDDTLDGGANDNTLECGDGDDVAINQGAGGTRNAVTCES